MHLSDLKPFRSLAEISCYLELGVLICFVDLLSVAAIVGFTLFAMVVDLRALGGVLLRDEGRF